MTLSFIFLGPRIPSSDAFEASASYLSAIKCHHSIAEVGGKELLAQAHIDCSLLTIIYTTHHGLHVCTPGDDHDQWVDIPPPTTSKGCISVLIGAQLERATGGALKAAEHRIVKPNSMPYRSLVFYSAPATRPCSTRSISCPTKTRMCSCLIGRSDVDAKIFQSLSTCPSIISH